MTIDQFRKRMATGEPIAGDVPAKLIKMID